MQLITITLNDHNVIIEKLENGIMTPAGFIPNENIITKEKERSNGKKDVFYFTSDYRPEISAADRDFIQALPDHARARILKLDYLQPVIIRTAAGLYRFENVAPDKVNVFMNELKKEKLFQEKKRRAAAIITNIIDKGGADELTPDEYMFIKSLYNDSISVGSGKLKGINSISTAVYLNERCKRNAKNKKSICSKCYAMRYAGMRSDLSRKLEINTLLYTTCIVPVELLPEINAQYFRLESFGDLNDVAQQINYFNVCNKNSRVSFAQWSKSPDITLKAIETGYNKPHNLEYVYSSHEMNKPAAAAILEKFYFIDKTFTVYDPQYIADHDININCGGRSCINCLNCYKKDGAPVVSEKLK